MCIITWCTFPAFPFLWLDIRRIFLFFSHAAQLKHHAGRSSILKLIKKGIPLRYIIFHQDRMKTNSMMINCRQSVFLLEQKQRQTIESERTLKRKKKHWQFHQSFWLPSFAVFIPAEWRMSLWCLSLRAKIPVLAFADTKTKSSWNKFVLWSLQKGNSMDI